MFWLLMCHHTFILGTFTHVCLYGGTFAICVWLFIYITTAFLGVVGSEPGAVLHPLSHCHYDLASGPGIHFHRNCPSGM
jgi:hypothetical protein